MLFDWRVLVPTDESFGRYSDDEPIHVAQSAKGQHNELVIFLIGSRGPERLNSGTEMTYHSITQLESQPPQLPISPAFSATRI